LAAERFTKMVYTHGCVCGSTCKRQGVFGYMHRIVWAGADYRKVCRYRGGNGLFTARTDNLHIHTVAVPHWFGVVEMQSPVRCATAGWMMVRLKRAVTRRAVVNIVVVWYGKVAGGEWVLEE
jgi:hypothetical protein